MDEGGARAEWSEADFRRRWYDAHVRQFEKIPDGDQRRTWRAVIDSQSREPLQLMAKLRRSRDLARFGADLQAWSAATAATTGFNGFSGQMLVNQIVKRADDPQAVGGLLANAMDVPQSVDEATAKLKSVVDFVETVRVGVHPQPTRIPFVLSYFWALQVPGVWPVAWAKSIDFVQFITGTEASVDPVERYLSLLELARDVDTSIERFELIAAWWSDDKPALLDPVLCDRAALGSLPNEPDTRPTRAANARALVAVAGHIGQALLADVAEAAQRSLVPKKPSWLWAADAPRGDLWVDWTIEQSGGLGIRLWLNARGVAIGLRPGWYRSGWYEEAADILRSEHVEGYRLLGGRRTSHVEDVEFVGAPGEFLFAKWFDRETISGVDLREEVIRIANDVAPLIDRLEAEGLGVEPASVDDPLSELVDTFRTQRGYPTAADLDDVAARDHFASLLRPDELAMADPIELRKIWNTGRYGSPGPQSVLNTTIRDGDDVELERILESIGYLCWGEDEPARRIDDLLAGGDRYVKGLGESVIMKLLAIAHPERFITVYPYSGALGKRRMLRLLGLSEPESESRGEIQVQANDLLRQRLDRLFPNDPKGMGSFLYWLAERDAEPELVAAEADPLDALSEELHVDRAFLDDIVALLEDKGQVVFYGPPGTGKTYLARKLAEALVPDATRRVVVQFHPSTSYEDFFEGYRPEVDDVGAMTYRLQPGPFADLVQRSAQAPGKRHLMIIDEINRANLPKVLGELLFLLEYRDVPVRTLYRPDDPFELPKDVWIIGTMNTADRSIALVDAALRRRFHFVPFFPNHGPMQGLLERWLEANEQDAWVGEVVAQVNDELHIALGGPHLQLGPSYFMKKGLDEAGLRRIWEYNIEPFIEDQFFGDPERVDYFRFVNVLSRYRESVSGAPVGDAEATASGLAEPE